jgi:peptidoglycan/LPS O-acetylase OafA/YrhL
MRLEGIDILRGLAVGFVIIYHFFELLGLQQHFLYPYVFSMGQLGVPLFFVISGYLIYRSVDYSISRKGIKSGVISYSLHRLFRILPAYYINFIFVFILAYFVLGTMDTWSFSFIKRQIVSHLTFTSYFIYKSSGLGINGAYWTLSIEMLWYMVVPFFFIFIKKDRYYFVIIAMALCYILSIDFKLWDSYLNLNSGQANYLPMHYYLYFQLLTQILYFISGIFIYKYMIQFKTLKKFNLMIFFLVIMFIFFIFSSHVYFINIFIIKMFVTLIAVSLMFILFYNRKLNFLHPLAWLGKISYSLYLWHMPILYIMKTLDIQELSSMVLIFIVMLLFISSLSYYLIEEGGFKLQEYFLK